MLIDNGLFVQYAALVYIDDWIMMASTPELVKTNMDYFDVAVTKLGFKLHPTKRASARAPPNQSSKSGSCSI